MRSDPNIDALSFTPECRRPRADQQHRQLRPVRWGQSLGLAALFDDLESLIACGDLRLMPNSAVRWLALRNLPSASGSRRSVCHATVARAVLRFGMPHLNFAGRAEGSCDFRLISAKRGRVRDGRALWHHVPSWAAGAGQSSHDFGREFAVLNRLSAAMTPSMTCQTSSASSVHPSDWFPTAYLGFRSGSEAELYRLATCQQPVGSTLRCRKCDRDVEVSAFRAKTLKLRIRLCSDGCVIARCPACGTEHKWRPDHAVPARHRHHVPVGFKDRFCRAVENRLPLVSIGPSIYCGSEPICRDRDWPNLPDARTRQLDLLVHRFRCRLTGQKRLVYLPQSALVQTRQGQSLELGQLWCHVLPEPPDSAWVALPLPHRYKAIDELLAGEAMANHLRRVWFDHQGLMCGDLGEHQRLWPADLVAFTAGSDMRPLGLYWDFAFSEKFFDEKLTAAIFPPFRVEPHRDFRRTLPGDVAVDASAGDAGLYRSTDEMTQGQEVASLQAGPVPQRLAS